jgi:hypothetical protein
MNYLLKAAGLLVSLNVATAAALAGLTGLRDSEILGAAAIYEDTADRDTAGNQTRTAACDAPTEKTDAHMEYIRDGK